MLRAVPLRVSDHGERPGTEQGAEIAVTRLGDRAKALLAPARVLFRHQADPGREVTTGSKGLGIGDAGNQSRRQHRSDAGNGIEPPTRLARAMPESEDTIKNADLFLEGFELNAERR